MDKLEKVEKLRDRANVSYEEAKAALEANDWDLLDAMVALEKSGRTDSPGQQQYSTSYDQQMDYISVKSTVEEQQKKEQPKFGRSIGEAMHSFFRICKENAFCIRRNGDLMLRIPLFAAVIILLVTWKFTIPAILISLLFSFRYSIEGADDLREVNSFMESAGEAAESLKEGFQNARAANKKEAHGTDQESSHT